MAKLSRQVDTGYRGSVGQIEVAITDDASGGIDFVMPEDGRIVDMIVQSRDTVGGADVQLSNDTPANITDAVDMDTENAVVHAGEIFRATANVSEGDVLTLTTNGANDRGWVVIEYLAV